MLCDSYFGDTEWEGFKIGLKKIFPDREVEDLPEGDPIFHTVFDINEKHQVANFRSMQGAGRTYRGNGSDPKWRGIRDERGRVMIMMTFNNDLGDSWQLADNPAYDEKYSSLGIRLGVNFVVYTMTH